MRRKSSFMCASRRPARERGAIPAQHRHHPDRRTRAARRADAAPHHAEHVDAVLARARVVAKAGEEHAIDDAADLPSRRLDERQPDVERAKRDAVEVAGDPPVRRQDEGTGRVGVLSAPGIVRVAEAERVGEGADLGVAPVSTRQASGGAGDGPPTAWRRPVLAQRARCRGCLAGRC